MAGLVPLGTGSPLSPHDLSVGHSYYRPSVGWPSFASPTIAIALAPRLSLPDTRSTLAISIPSSMLAPASLYITKHPHFKKPRKWPTFPDSCSEPEKPHFAILSCIYLKRKCSKWRFPQENAICADLKRATVNPK